MKTLRFFGMMLMAVLMSFSMTACGDDDDDDSKDGGGTPDYVGTWVITDTRERMQVMTLKTNEWETDIYKIRDNNEYKKEHEKGSLSVSGNKLTLTNAPFKTATYSISGNSMTIYPDQETEMGDKFVITRITEEQVKKVAAWETLVLASQNK
jgi:hypothetical protein